MTNLELINMLNKHPMDAEVFIYDVDIIGPGLVTGCVAGPDPKSSKYIIELCSDTMQG